MSIAKVYKNVYLIGGKLIDKNDTNAYLIYNEKEDYYTLIDTTTGSNIEYIIETLLEIMKGEKKLKFIILTSCKKENAGGLNTLYNLFYPITIAHFPDSLMIRQGECEREKIVSSPISLEIKERYFELNDIRIFLTRTLTKGSIIVLYQNILFTGSNTRLSTYDPNIKYICDINECRK
ncbi:hydrolase [Sulfolobus sp. A20]|uniref:MBL fold metallo-hydrolase n=1 Tax=Sulfolobaceae TaxID=118883 RepID=UPI000845F765|nr:MULTISPECIES: MBL fold metallo-hydrolase [unclassified Sulfolobus]TRM76124.1 MBL fold metallo-hydrolase [Sulfolobus sp. A20-N-F8]TRM85991.1 MBL fold metallo-hydrolase [Sulfolobus sp. E3]TRM99215.1 MBL fold metallo-hydrolase [Sulfolobus sp. F1]AOL16117.1 hydrolase [Sulfolobus sp. A20]TRM94429.1 MBL fold metallo-hydrolase [Sulfolobus sp. B1]